MGQCVTDRQRHAPIPRVRGESVVCAFEARDCVQQKTTTFITRHVNHVVVCLTVSSLFLAVPYCDGTDSDFFRMSGVTTLGV
jgi:hypothetical protein